MGYPQEVASLKVFPQTMRCENELRSPALYNIQQYRHSEHVKGLD